MLSISQMQISSKNTLTDTLRITFDGISGHPVTQSSQPKSALTLAYLLLDEVFIPKWSTLPIAGVPGLLYTETLSCKFIF